MNISNEQYQKINKLSYELRNDIISLKMKERILRTEIEDLFEQTRIEDIISEILNEARTTESIASEILNQNRFFDSNNFDKIRVLKQAEFSNKTESNSYYIISVDVGIKCDTSICIFKVLPELNEFSNKSLIYIETCDYETFEFVACKIKFLASLFQVKAVVMNGNGMGMGLIELLVRPTKDSQGNIYMPYSVVNDSRYNLYKTEDSIPILHVIKYREGLFEAMDCNCLQQINSKKVKALVHEECAKLELSNNKYVELSRIQLHKKVLPHILTTELKIQLLNLRLAMNECGHLKTERINKKLPMNIYYAFACGLWWIKEQDNLKLKKHF